MSWRIPFGGRWKHAHTALWSVFVLGVVVVPAGSSRAADIPGRGSLPDGRGWERVTPEEKGGADVGGASYDTRTRSAPDGNGMIFTSHGVFAGAPSGAYPSYYLARRGSGGWSTASITPPSAASIIGGVGGPGRTAAVLFVNSDLSKSVVETNAPILPGTIEGVPSLFSGPISGHPLILQTPGGPTYYEALAGAPTFQVATPDVSHVVFTSPFRFTTDAPAGTDEKLYETVAGSVRLAGVLPDGTPASGAWAGSHDQSVHNAISADGNRLYFTTSYGGTGPLYIREGAVTTEVSADSATFYSATSDGRYAVYRQGGATSTVYRYDAASGRSEELALDGEPLDGTDPGVATVLATSDDLDYVYFVAAGDLVAGQTPTGADSAIYLWHEGVVRFVATLRNDQDPPLTGPASDAQGVIPQVNGWINRPWVSWTPDGKQLVFDTTAQVTEDDANGYRQVYRIDAETGGVSCISCIAEAPNGDSKLVSTQPPGGGTWARPLGQRNSISDDGRRVVFSSATGLVDADRNRRLDVYVWQKGNLALLSDGKSKFDAWLLDASSTGDDVFFATRARLVGDDRDDLVDIYDARVGGGTEEPSPPQPRCVEDGCQHVPTPPPGENDPGSSSFGVPEGVVGDADDLKLRLRRLTARQVAALAAGRSVMLSVSGVARGTVRARAVARIGGEARVVINTTGTATNGTGLQLPIRLSREARTRLAAGSPLAVRLTVSSSRSAATASLSVRLRARTSTTAGALRGCRRSRGQKVGGRCS